MNRFDLRVRGVALILVGLAGPVLGCQAAGGVTPVRLQVAIATTFANLIETQESLMGLPRVDASALRSAATCRKRDARQVTAGAGEWLCTVSWFVPGHRSPVEDTYDVAVSGDGCYAATADGAESRLGGPTVTTPTGLVVPNLLHTFEGCFDAR